MTMYFGAAYGTLGFITLLAILGALNRRVVLFSTTLFHLGVAYAPVHVYTEKNLTAHLETNIIVQLHVVLACLMLVGALFASSAARKSKKN